jgi:hypothetical protein
LRSITHLANYLSRNLPMNSSDESSFYCRFPLAEFAIGDSQIVESLGKLWVQPSGFNVLLYGLSEPALRCERDSRFVVFGGRATRVTLLTTVEILSCSPQLLKIGPLRSPPGNGTPVLPCCPQENHSTNCALRY